MATYTKTVDPNGGSDYASLNAWEAGEQTLYSSGDIAIADCKRTGATKDTTAVTVAGWTTGVVPKIIVNAAHRHEGKWSDQQSGGSYIYTLEASLSADAVFTVATPRIVEVFGLQVRNLAVPGATPSSTVRTTAGGITLTDCIVRGARSTVRLEVPAYVNTLINTVIYGANNTISPGRAINTTTAATGSTTNLYNCTIFGDATTGQVLHEAGTINAVNCYAMKFNLVGGSWGTSDYNVSSDATAPGTNKATGKTAYTDYFVDPANGDFHLKGSSLALFGLSGTDLSGTFTTDIDGVTRSAPWDIGADQYAAAGGSFTGTYSATQAAQSHALTANLGFSGVATESQPAQPQMLTALLAFNGTTAQVQVANTEALSALLGFSGAVSQQQAAQAQAIYEAITITGAVASTQAAQIATLTASLAFGGASAQTQAAQVEALAAVLSFAGSTAQSQQAQSEALEGLLSFGGAITQAQAIQAETLTAILAFSGSVSQTQAQQRQAISDLVAQLYAILTITARDPLALRVTARDPLALRVTARA